MVTGPVPHPPPNNTVNYTEAVDGFYSGPKPNTATALDKRISLMGLEIRNVSRYGFDPHEGTIRYHSSESASLTIMAKTDLQSMDRQMYC